MRTLAGIIVGVSLLAGCNTDQAGEVLGKILSLFPSAKEECERQGLTYTERRAIKTGQPDTILWECQ